MINVFMECILTFLTLLSIHEKQSLCHHTYVPVDKHISHLPNLIPTLIVPQAFAWIVMLYSVVSHNHVGNENVEGEECENAFHATYLFVPVRYFELFFHLIFNVCGPNTGNWGGAVGRW